jgi:hypothetical protein
MLTLKECKRILDNEAIGLTDEEIILIRDWLSNIADIAIESLDKTD